ncbi:acyl carrier protein [Priestia filamentosa]|uniref:acyl carrier protein n=1 Tax=Priestia filamentosa TaxID=1402861 RepID=UPI001FB54733|nr:acyl carrier protein [Priestia filamentosa]UOE58257.1 acyl carrier protein [Priestia filamentosa]
MVISHKETVEKVTKIFIKCTDLVNFDKESILEKDFSDLGITSLTFAKIVNEIENEFKFEFDDEDLVPAKFPNLRSLIEYINTKL